MSIDSSKKPFQITYSSILAVTLKLHNSDLGSIEKEIRRITLGADDYFDHDPTLIDLTELEDAQSDIDWPALLALLCSFRLHPVAVCGAAPDMEPALRAHGLSLDIHARPQLSVTPEEIDAKPNEPVVEAMPAEPRKSLIIDTPVRAGQRVYARDADLIVTESVNSGAELIADGSIHVYAPLRGRALAGAKGDTSARIFTLSMEAELVSIAGVYNIFAEGFQADTRNKPMQIRLLGDRIDLSPVNLDSRL